jgi:hypothetical protein
MDNEYSEFAKLKSRISDNEFDLAKDKREFEELEAIIKSDDDGSHATIISSHAFDQISDRLEQVTRESGAAYSDIFSKQPEDILFIPSKLKAFIITMLSKAREDGSFEKKRSKNSNGFEFVYNVNISKWSKNGSTLLFTCFVENNVVKTGYFNFVNKPYDS